MKIFKKSKKPTEDSHTNDAFEFDHIDKSLTETNVTTLKDFYSHYDKKYWCFKKSYKRYKLLEKSLTLSGVGLVTIGTITGGITLNPIILGFVNGAGVILASFVKIKNYKKKIELSRIAFTTYDKVLIELRAALRGDSFDKEDLIDRMKVLDDIIIGQSPLADRFAKKYNKKFTM